MIRLSVNGRLPAGIRRRDLAGAMRLTFRAARRRERGSVGIAFLPDARMRKLNRQYRRCDRPTDVLSFAAQDPWGDIVLAPAYIRSSAKAQRVPFREELLRVSVHGLLHLFGYDHATKKDEKRMFGLQERVVGKFVARRS